MVASGELEGNVEGEEEEEVEFEDEDEIMEDETVDEGIFSKISDL